MAKVAFTKLNLKKKGKVIDKLINDIAIEIKQYLPVEDKIKIVTNVLRDSADDNNFANPIKVEVFFNLELIYAYTNINFTEKQKEDPQKLYDLLEENDIFFQVIAGIPDNEYQLLLTWTQETIDAFYNYRNSVMGILEQVSTDYKDLNFDANQIKENIAEPGNLDLLKQVLDKLG